MDHPFLKLIRVRERERKRDNKRVGVNKKRVSEKEKMNNKGERECRERTHEKLNQVSLREREE